MSVDNGVVEAAVLRWLERAVIGLNLCPFARAPHVAGRIRIAVSHATDVDGLLGDLSHELMRLKATSENEVETTLLVHPDVLQDFLDFNDFLEVADATLEALDLDGELQIASFHPQYQFADSAPDDIENYSNRAPYPILHLLRESSIERVVDAIDDPDLIYQRNMDTLRRLGRSGWDALWTEASQP